MATANNEVDRVAFFYSDFVGYQYVINPYTRSWVTKYTIQRRSHEVRFIRIPQAKTDDDIVAAAIIVPAIIRGHGGSAQGDANKSQNVNQ
jgi:hypothetical protein